MKILNQSIQLVICVTPSGDLKNVNSMYPSELNYFEVVEFLELLKENEYITLHETKDVYININNVNGTIEITHMLKDNKGSVDSVTMSKHNMCVNTELFFVHS